MTLWPGSRPAPSASASDARAPSRWPACARFPPRGTAWSARTSRSGAPPRALPENTGAPDVPRPGPQPPETAGSPTTRCSERSHPTHGHVEKAQEALSMPARDWNGGIVRYPDPAVEVLDPRFATYRLQNAAVERIATGFRWAEG